MYRVVYKTSVKKSLRGIPKAQLERIIDRITKLAGEPRPAGVVKLQGTPDLYRVRQGDYRIIYRIHDDIVTVAVVAIGHRREVYGRG